MKKLLSPHTLLTSIMFVVALLFPYERVAVAADASAISRYSNKTQERFTSTIDYVNEHRSRHGRSPLFYSEILTNTAKQRAEEIARTGKLTHFDSQGRTFYKYFDRDSAPEFACENIASSISGAPSIAFYGWKKSLSHEQCMLDMRMTSYGIFQITTFMTATPMVITVLIEGNK